MDNTILVLLRRSKIFVINKNHQFISSVGAKQNKLNGLYKCPKVSLLWS